QGDGRRDLAKRDRVLATAKHYAGDGDTQYGTGNGDYTIDQGISITSREDFFQTSLRQYIPAVQDHNVGNMHAHKELITDYLKGEIGFDGLVISDYNGIDHINGADFADNVRQGVL